MLPVQIVSILNDGFFIGWFLLNPLLQELPIGLQLGMLLLVFSFKNVDDFEQSISRGLLSDVLEGVSSNIVDIGGHVEEVGTGGKEWGRVGGIQQCVCLIGWRRLVADAALALFDGRIFPQQATIVGLAFLFAHMMLQQYSHNYASIGRSNSTFQPSKFKLISHLLFEFILPFYYFYSLTGSPSAFLPISFLSTRPSQSVLILYCYNQRLRKMDTLTGSTVPLDLEMQHLVPQILSHAWLGGSSKHLKIRIHSWLARLECIVSNNIWRKNRNNYYRILFIMLQCRQVMEPFTVMPPEDVPTLHKHQINCILTKLATRLKEKEREKENKQARTGKPDPLELWNLLEVNCTKNINTNAISSSVLSKTKTIMIDTTAKQRNLDGVAFDYLSPISEGVHARINSNLSECTYNSIERCRDLITNCNVSDQFNLGMAGEGLEDKLPAQMAKEEVKYFKKNRSKYQGEAKILPINKSQLYVKIYAFLKKHQCHLKDDLEYQEVMKELSHSLGRTQEEVAMTAPYEDEGGKNPECGGKENAAQEEDFSLIEIDENSYDYLSGRYSQYSSIQVDSGLSPERIKFLDQRAEETGLKKVNGLDSYRSRGVEANPTFRRGISLQPL